MDQQRTRIQEDLRGLIGGEVRCDDLFAQLYGSDASIYQIRPLAVVLPRSTADVSATIQYAAEQRLPVHARGAGTGLAGESLGPGIVVDFSRHLRRIVRTDAETVRVQAGVVHERLNAHLRPLGRHFGPDPAMSQVTTLGSVLALDSSGSHWPRYGSARRHVQSLQVVLADGSVIEAGREPLAATPPATAEPPGPEERKRDLVQRLADVLRQNAAAIERHAPRSKVNRCGYELRGVLAEGHLDLAHLIVGCEGTLALIAEATLATQPLPRHRGLAVLLFDRLDGAARAVQEIAPFDPAACDLMDRRHLTLAREADVRYHVLIPQQAEALLLVEQDGRDQAEVRDRLRQVVDRVRRKKRLAFDSRQVYDPEEMELFWQLARRVVPTLHRVRGTSRPLPFVEDFAVPPETLPDFLVQLQNVLKRHQVTASLFAHAGHGQLHLRPFLDLGNADDVRKIEPLAADLYGAVFAVEGTISGEHGAGLSRSPFVREQFGPLYEVFREIKRIFDPWNTLNPGRVVWDEQTRIVDHLRPRAQELAAATTDGAPAPPLVDLQLNWSREEAAAMARECHGCGACRVQSGEARMCPIFHFAPAEEASPRAKANLMRGLFGGQLDAGLLASSELRAVADLCVNCHMCRLECPSNVDIPRLMLEAKAAHVAANGLRPSDWALTRLEWFSALGSRLAPLANWVLANPQARWVVEQLLGVAQARRLPRFAGRPFLRRAARRRLTIPTRRTGRKVLYFVDTYANYHDPQLAEALVAVFEHNGVAVYVHPRQVASGMAPLAFGAVDRARRLAARNVALLAEAVRQGYTIVASEPTAALCLTREYPHLLGDDDAALVARSTQEACTYLWKLHLAGTLQLDLKPINATLAYHTPCHLKALEVGTPGANLLRLVPGLTVQLVERGCSGMAGVYGLKQENFRNSVRAGWGLIAALRETALQAGTTECSACKMQMEQGASKATIHPLKLLALAYGLMPEVAALLTARRQELVVT
jgi:FAD/FMN-containing dehydrogenase/Fe-S oxidoreductase